MQRVHCPVQYYYYYYHAVIVGVPVDKTLVLDF